MQLDALLGHFGVPRNHTPADQHLVVVRNWRIMLADRRGRVGRRRRARCSPPRSRRLRSHRREAAPIIVLQEFHVLPILLGLHLIALLEILRSQRLLRI